MIPSVIDFAPSNYALRMSFMDVKQKDQSGEERWADGRRGYIIQAKLKHLYIIYLRSIALEN